MCQELEDELERGRKLAEGLVSHVETMGANMLTIPTQGKDCSVWEIVVTRIGGVKG